MARAGAASHVVGRCARRRSFEEQEEEGQLEGVARPARWSAEVSVGVLQVGRWIEAVQMQKPKPKRPPLGAKTVYNVKSKSTNLQFFNSAPLPVGD